MESGAVEKGEAAEIRLKKAAVAAVVSLDSVFQNLFWSTSLIPSLN